MSTRRYILISGKTWRHILQVYGGFWNSHPALKHSSWNKCLQVVTAKYHSPNNGSKQIKHVVASFLIIASISRCSSRDASSMRLFIVPCSVLFISSVILLKSLVPTGSTCNNNRFSVFDNSAESSTSSSHKSLGVFLESGPTQNSISVALPLSTRFQVFVIFLS